MTITRQDEQEMGRARKEHMKKKATAERKANEEATHACGVRVAVEMTRGLARDHRGGKKRLTSQLTRWKRGAPGQDIRRRRCR